MPRMQVYLSDELYDVVKSQGLSASRMLQDAVRQHCDRQEKIRAAHEYAEEVFAELGPPTAEEIEWAETKARRIVEWLSAGEQSDAKPPAISPTTPPRSRCLDCSRYPP